MISGVMLPLETMKSFRLGELLKYCTSDWQVGNIFTFYAVMNKGKWDRLPENVKTVIDAINEEWIERSAVGWNDVDLAGAAFFKSNGGKFIQLPDAATERWNQAVVPVIDRYLDETSQKGPDKATLEERVRFIRQTRDELIAEQKTMGIPMPYDE